MSWLSVFFRKDSTKLFVSLIVKAAKIFLGKIVGEVYQIVLEEVLKAESLGGNGWTRWEAAYRGIRSRMRTDVPEFILSILIEGAVAELKSVKK